VEVLKDQNDQLSREKVSLQHEQQGLVLNLGAALTDRNYFHDQVRLTGILLDPS
jgi:hypothetical protein